MAIDIDTAFVKQYESEVHMAYQRMGSKLTGTVRTKSNIKGEDTTFQKVGTGTASTKSRHGNVPVMSIEHTTATCTLADYYAADYIDKLDELKINHDERQVVAKSAAAALGRKSDQLIIDALDTTANADNVAHGSAGLTQAKVDTVTESFGEGDIPEDGDRYFVVSPAAWNDLLSIDAFANADYIGSDDLPYKGGMVARRWQGFLFFVHSGLPLSGTTRDCFAYHKTAVGFASGCDVKTHFDWVPEKAAFLSNSYMSQGACMIDDNAVIEVQVTE